MNTKLTYLFAGLVVVALGAAYYFYPRTVEGPVTGSTNPGEQVACTMDAKQCPDGSYVGRTGPKCEFAACPTSGKVTPKTVTLALGQSGEVGGVRLTPQKVEQDSRCPIDVQCIQAGTVKVQVGVMPGAESVTFTLNQAITTGPGMKVLLSEVTPAPNSKKTIVSSDYRFTFVEQVDTGLMTYYNSSPELITVSSPTAGGAVTPTFTVTGKARGGWYFEGSFLIQLEKAGGGIVGEALAKPEGDWMSADFVPFTATIKMTTSYRGPATLILHKDNASGLPANDASLSFPVTVVAN